MNTSLQASGGRHLAPANPLYPFRAVVLELLPTGWNRLAVFEAEDAETANDGAVELCGNLIDDGALDVHYYVGEVAP